MLINDYREQNKELDSLMEVFKKYENVLNAELRRNPKNHPSLSLRWNKKFEDKTLSLQYEIYLVEKGNNYNVVGYAYVDYNNTRKIKKNHYVENLQPPVIDWVVKHIEDNINDINNTRIEDLFS